MLLCVVHRNYANICAGSQKEIWTEMKIFEQRAVQVFCKRGDNRQVIWKISTFNARCSNFAPCSNVYVFVHIHPYLFFCTSIIIGITCSPLWARELLTYTNLIDKNFLNWKKITRGTWEIYLNEILLTGVILISLSHPSGLIWWFIAASDVWRKI